MYCPYCKGDMSMAVEKYGYHRRDETLPQPYNTFWTVLYKCPICGVTVETSQQVRITNKKES